MQIKIQLPKRFYEEEERMFKVDPETKRLWAVLLDLLLEFDRVCRENGIKYMIDGGTLLGAMRHGGFIPWDDDVDVVMLRPEYEKLERIASSAFRHPYFWQTNETDPGCGRCFGRLRNSETTAIQKSEMRDGKPLFKFNQGAFMDVFVCDNIPDDEKLRIDYFSKCTYERNMSWGMRNVRARRPNGGFLSRLSYLKQRMPIFWEECILGRDIVNEHCNRLTRVAQAYNDMKTEYVSHTTFKPCYGDRLCVLVPRKYFEELVLVSFEGFQVSATKYADEYLTMIYKNWRKYVVGSNEHGGVLFDADRSYVEYLKED